MIVRQKAHSKHLEHISLNIPVVDGTALRLLRVVALFALHFSFVVLSFRNIVCVAVCDVLAFVVAFVFVFLVVALFAAVAAFQILIPLYNA